MSTFRHSSPILEGDVPSNDRLKLAGGAVAACKSGKPRVGTAASIAGALATDCGADGEILADFRLEIPERASRIEAEQSPWPPGLAAHRSAPLPHLIGQRL